jgi:two-component system sensor histidine kinase ChiS
LSRGRFIWFIVVVIAVFVGINCVTFLGQGDQPQARNGILNLHDWDSTTDEVIALQGEWTFYPGVLLSGADSEQHRLGGVNVQVPGDWHKVIDKVFHQGGFGFGTYRLRVEFNQNISDLGFRIPVIRTAHKLFVNGEEIGSNGVVSADPVQYQAQVVPYTAYTNVGQSRGIDIYLQVANYEYANSGGMVHAMQLGSIHAINKLHQRDASLEFGMIVAFGFLCTFFGFMHYQSPRNGWIYISLLFLSIAVSISFQGTKWLFLIWPGLSYHSGLIIYWISVISMITFMFVSIQHGAHIHRPIKYGILTFNLVLIILVISLPIPVITSFAAIWIIQMMFVFVYVLYILLRSLQHGDTNTRYQFLAFFMFASHSFSNLLLQLGISRMSMWYFLQIIFFSGLFTFMIMYQYFLASRKVKAVSEELKRVERFKNEFTANISEQMRTPLNVIINITDARLYGDDSLTLSQRQDLELVTSVGWTMRRLVDDLMDLSNLQEQAIQLHCKPVDLYTVMDEVVERVRYMIYNDSIQLINHMKFNMSPILGDEQRLYQILTGILQQGIRTMTEGSITIEGKDRGDFVEVHISLRGKGITTEQKSLIREVWSHKPHQRFMHNGEVLGLYLVKELIDLHQGTVNMNESPQEMSLVFTLPTVIKNNNEDMKSVITSALPSTNLSDPPLLGTSELVTQSMDITDISHGIQASDSDAGHILIIDDDTLNLKLLLRVLALDQYHVTVVQNPADIINERQQLSQVDVVIINRLLRGTSGVTICKTIREWYTLFELPILLLTSQGHGERAIESSLYGANDFLKKPVEASELRVRVRTLLHMKRSVAEGIRMELGFLQAQIKPHFLFNTLNSISALSKHKPEVMNHLLTQLGHYLRESFHFDSSHPLMSFQRELKLVQSYLNIEKVRFDDWLNFEIDILTSTNFTIPPLTLQPLVENAVRHGIMTRTHGGHIRIVVTRDNQYIWISVCDDGVGMSPEAMEHVLGTPTPEAGIGIRNIDRRLKQLFGYGLIIESSSDNGTEIKIQLPIEKVGYDESNFD